MPTRLLIQIEGNEPHWSQSAQGLLTALIMWVKMLYGRNANLEQVRALLTEPDEWVTEVSTDRQPHQRLVKGLRVTAAHMVARGGYIIESLAARFTEDTREISSIRSTADTQTRWLLSPQMRADLKKGRFRFESLKERPTTVYIVVPASQLRLLGSYLRTLVVCALRALYRPGGIRTRIIIDEAAALGHLAPLEDAFGLVRGFRVAITLVFQDWSQIASIYGKRASTFIANSGFLLALRPNDFDSAEMLFKAFWRDYDRSQKFLGKCRNLAGIKPVAEYRLGHDG